MHGKTLKGNLPIIKSGNNFQIQQKDSEIGYSLILFILINNWDPEWNLLEKLPFSNLSNSHIIIYCYLVFVLSYFSLRHFGYVCWNMYKYVFIGMHNTQHIGTTVSVYEHPPGQRRLWSWGWMPTVLGQMTYSPSRGPEEFDSIIMGGGVRDVVIANNKAYGLHIHS